MEGETNYKRPSWDQYFMEIMDAIAKRGTCERGRSGCVIAKDKQIISAGYVGSPLGEDHCDDVGHLFQKRYNDDGTFSMHCVRTVHAEQNAICQAAKRGVSIAGATLYCRMTPCPVCAKMIINCGISRVVAQKKYHDGAETERLFLRAGIAFENISEEEEQYSGKGDKKGVETELRPLPLDSNHEKLTLSQAINLKIKKLANEAIIPNFAYDDDAGMDLYSIEDIEIPPGSRAKVSTGLAFEIPKDYVGMIWDRTSVSIKKGLKIAGGVVDSGYRGELFVGMVNVSKEPVEITKGEKVAQMVVQKFFHPQIEIVDELAESERGSNTLGSSDLKPIDPVDDLGLDYLPDEETELVEEDLTRTQIFEEVESSKAPTDTVAGVPTDNVEKKEEGQDGKSRW